MRSLLLFNQPRFLKTEIALLAYNEVIENSDAENLCCLYELILRLHALFNQFAGAVDRDADEMLLRFVGDVGKQRKNICRAFDFYGLS